VPETVRNTTTEVGLWLAGNAPVYVHGVLCPAAGEVGGLENPGTHGTFP